MEVVREDLKTLVDWEGPGFRICCEAINGKQGLELFQKYRPQLVITDIKMPVMNGLEMAQEILSIYPKVCVILLTAYDEFDLARNALGMGITHYLLKHEIGETNLTELLVKIRTQLSKAQESRRKSIEEQIRGSLMGTLPSKSEEDGGEEFLDMEKSIFSFVLFRGRNGISGDTLANALHCCDTARVKLLAYHPNICVNRPIIKRCVYSPNTINQFFSCHDPPCIFNRQFKQLYFLGSQIYGFAVSFR